MKGIFRKLLLTYMTILAAVIIVLSLLLFQFLQAHLFRDKQDTLLETARYVNTLLIRHQRGDLGYDALLNAVDIIGETTNSRILILDGINEPGDISPPPDIPGLKEDDLGASLDLILGGETLLRRRFYSKELDVHVVAVGLPVQSGEQISGAIILFSPVYHIELALAKVKGIIGFTSLVSLFLGAGVIYILSRRLSGPIVQVSRAAGKIAQGEKTTDLPGETDDEVGQLIRSFNQMKNQLARMEKVRREFLTGISHELRTPLTAIRGFVQGIHDGVISPEDQEKYLQLTLTETVRLTKLIDDLLELGKLESGSITLHRQTVDLAKIVGEGVHLFSDQAKAKNIALTYQAKGDIPLAADGDRLRQVIWNLLANAIIYTPPGGRVEVAASSDRDGVTMEVRDTGVGIPEEELPLVFHMFHRVDKSRHASTGGTGLGLAIVKNIVDLHGGTVTLGSKPGEGTRVTIKLPPPEGTSD